MGKRILAISTSPRVNSNSEAMLDEFIRGAREAGNEVEKVSLRGKDIKFCQGCLACQRIGHCVIKDDSNEIVDKMHDAEVIAFATPIYYYEMCGQMKTLLDRANPLFGSDYKFTDIYLMTSAAEDAGYVPEKAESGLCGWIDCFDRASLKGSVFAGGVTEPGAIKGHRSLAKAYELGKKA